MNTYYLVVKNEDNMRIDVYLTQKRPELSRSFIQKLIREGMVTVNGALVRPSVRVKPGDKVVMQVPEPVELEVKPEKIPLEIYYEDKDLLVVNKPRGMVVHPAQGNYNGTLVNALLFHCRDLSGINGVLRPGIVHRLDKDTSGLLMVAKNDRAHLCLAEQLKERRVTRFYLALVHGKIKRDTGVVDAHIGRDTNNRQRMTVTRHNSRPARTSYQVLKRLGNYTLIKLKLDTGRTHQIRVHMKYIGHPVVGDTKYGPSRPHFNLNGQFLHAAVLGFFHPRTGVYLEFIAPLPKELSSVLKKLDPSFVDGAVLVEGLTKEADDFHE